MWAWSRRNAQSIVHKSANIGRGSLTKVGLRRASADCIASRVGNPRTAALRDAAPVLEQPEGCARVQPDATRSAATRFARFAHAWLDATDCRALLHSASEMCPAGSALVKRAPSLTVLIGRLPRPWLRALALALGWRPRVPANCTQFSARQKPASRAILPSHSTLLHGLLDCAYSQAAAAAVAVAAAVVL